MYNQNDFNQTMDPPDKPKYLADRVSRIEAHELDQELSRSIDDVIDELELPAFGEEVKTILRFYLFINDIRSCSTVGMRVYNLDIADITKTTHPGEPVSHRPSKSKLILLGLGNVIGSYLMSRRYNIERGLKTSYIGKLNLSWLTLDNAILLYRSVSALNFVLFLKNSKYLTIPERVLGVASALTDQGYGENVMLNRVQIEYIYRERIWQTLSEFLTTLIPLVNFEVIKNRIVRSIGLASTMETKISLAEKISTESNAGRCAICSKQPFNPHTIGCRHVFCYYCINAQYLTDPSIGYSCRLCNYKTIAKLDVRRFKIMTAIR